MPISEARINTDATAGADVKLLGGHPPDQVAAGNVLVTGFPCDGVLGVPVGDAM
jgi:hypothetical protein